MDELNERKMLILKAIVDEYTLTGTPVGSRSLAKSGAMSLSAATLRNEMADLEEMGYLEKQHTSSGRVPTEEAYRLYVDRMVQVGEVTAEQAREVRSYFEGKTSDVGELCRAAAGALSSLTERVALVASPDASQARLRRVHLMKVSEGRALVILVTDTDDVRNEMVPISPKISEAELETLSSRLTKAVEGVPIAEAAERIEICAREAAAEQKRVMAEVFAAINKNGVAADMFLGGRENIWRYPEYQDIAKLRRMVALLDKEDKLRELLAGAPALEFSVRIGSELEGLDLPDLSVVTATYRVGSKSVGTFGVIGPARANYARVLSVVRCVGASLGDMLSQLMRPDKERK